MHHCSPAPPRTTSMEDHHLLMLLLFPVIVMSTLLLHSFRSTKCRRPSQVATVPPSPWRLPFVGNLHQLAVGTLPHRTLAALAAAHGPVMLLRLGQVRVVVVSSARAAREVMQTQDHIFATRPSLAIPSKLFYGCTDVAFAPHGPYWLRARKTTVLHLLSPARVRAYRAVREEEVAALVRKVRRWACDGGVVPVSELLAGFAKDVIGRIVFGASAATRAEGWGAKVEALLEEGNALLGTFHVGDYFPSLAWVGGLDGTDAMVAKAFEKIDAVLEEIVDAAERRIGVDKGEALQQHDSTFVDVLLSISFSGAEQAEWSFSRDNVKALLAGMVYLKAVIKETMRLHPPGPLLIPREAMEPTSIQQYDIESKIMVIVNAWAIGRDPDTWECPEEFRPERFLGSEVDFQGHHFELIPFGSGRRVCPGINFTMSIMEVTIANLVARFDWALPEVAAEVDMEEAPGITSRKRVPLHVLATPQE